MPGESNEPFNPLDKRNLAESIATAIERAPIHPLAPPQFKAAGLYFLYYNGPFADYAPLTMLNGSGCHWPIYIGKGMPPGVRRGQSMKARRGGNRGESTTAFTIIKNQLSRFPIWM